MLYPLAFAVDSADFLPDFSSARGLFCALAWVSTLLALAVTCLSLFVGVEADGDGDLSSVDSDTGDGDAGLFSLRAIIGFFLGFGWGGFIAVQCGAGVLLALGAAAATGVGMFLLIAFVIRGIYGLKNEVVFDYATLVGKTGTVYVSIPANGEPGGQVQVAAGQLLTLPAVQTGAEPLPAQTPIVVTAASPQQLTVRPLS